MQTSARAKNERIKCTIVLTAQCRSDAMPSSAKASTCASNDRRHSDSLSVHIAATNEMKHRSKGCPGGERGSEHRASIRGSREGRQEGEGGSCLLTLPHLKEWTVQLRRETHPPRRSLFARSSKLVNLEEPKPLHPRPTPNDPSRPRKGHGMPGGQAKHWAASVEACQRAA